MEALREHDAERLSAIFKDCERPLHWYICMILQDSKNHKVPYKIWRYVINGSKSPSALSVWYIENRLKEAIGFYGDCSNCSVELPVSSFDFSGSQEVVDFDEQEESEEITQSKPIKDDNTSYFGTPPVKPVARRVHTRRVW